MTTRTHHHLTHPAVLEAVADVLDGHSLRSAAELRGVGRRMLARALVHQASAEAARKVLASRYREAGAGLPGYRSSSRLEYPVTLGRESLERQPKTGPVT